MWAIVALLKAQWLLRRHWLALAGVLLLALLGGWLYADWMAQRQLAQVKSGLVNAMAYTTDAVQDEAGSAAPLGAMLLMGLNSSVIKATASGELLPDSAAVLAQLAVARALFKADGVYIINQSGVVVAHSTNETSSTGGQVGFRPYFKNAMAGTPNVYAGVGSGANDRGLYYAAPVHADATLAGQVIGVVMLKMPPTRVDQLLRFAGAPLPCCCRRRAWCSTPPATTGG